MGQPNTKPESSSRVQQTPPRETTRSIFLEDPIIHQQDTFDSNFTLISPMSELSNPSQFLPKRHHYNQAAPNAIVPSSQTRKLQNNRSNVVLRNVPPLPPELQQAQVKSKNERQLARELDDYLVKKAKKKEKRKQQIKHIKEAFAGCAHGSLEHAEKVRTATATTFTACAKKTGEALNLSVGACAKVTRNTFLEEQDLLGRAESRGLGLSLPWDAEKKPWKMSSAARDSLSDVNINDSDFVAFPDYTIDAQDCNFDSRDSNCLVQLNQSDVGPGGVLMSNVNEDQGSPLAHLDHVGAAAAGLHQEDDYFDRLAKPVSSPSPFATTSRTHQVSEAIAINLSLFSSASSIDELQSSDPDFAREASKPKWQRVKEYEVTPSTKAERMQEDNAALAVKAKRQQDSHSGRSQDDLRPSEKSNSAKSENSSSGGQLKESTSTHRIETGRDKKSGRSHSYPVDTVEKSMARFSDSRTQKKSLNKQDHNDRNRREDHMKSRGGLNRDYRNIALCTSDETSSPQAQRRNYTSCSPSASSTCSNGENSRGPLLTTQTLYNAAFLFSSAYAGDDVQLLRRQQPTRDPAFSISTFAARARLSSVSSRSQPVITIPVSKSWDSAVTATSNENDSDFGISKISLADRRNRHVRFSDSYQAKSNPITEIVEETKSFAKETRPLQSFPERIEAPLIESKLSDLTETTESKHPLDNDAMTLLSVSSILSITSDHQKFFTEKSSTNGSDILLTDSMGTELQFKGSLTKEEGSNASPGSVETEMQSTSSSNIQGSVHWTYHEEDGKVTATPNLNRKRSPKNGALATTSPILRFRAAKEMFANPTQKEIPTKRTPPRKFFSRTPRKTAVASRITSLNERVKIAEQQAKESKETDPINDQVVTRNPAIRVDHFSHSPELASGTDFVNGDKQIAASLVSAIGEMDTSMSIADTNASEDPFAEIMSGKGNYDSREPEVPGALALGIYRNVDTTSSVFSYNSTDSSVKTSDLMRPKSRASSSSSRQSKVSLNYLHTMSIDRSQVNPSEVYMREKVVETTNLCLSPTQRTPIQARKWRTLAAAAHKNENMKKTDMKRGNRSALSERNINVL